MSGYGRKKVLVKDLEVDRFCDLICEVVKMFYTHDAMDLYVTDYTENKHLFNYTDPDDPEVIENFGYASAKNWTGPYGQITIPIRLWEPHASYARQNIEVGDIVFLQNVRPKFDQDNKLEGRLHQDRKYPDKVCVMKCRDSRQLATFQQLKAAYEEERTREKTNDPHVVPKKASAKASAKKKEERKEKRRLQKELEQRELEEKLRHETRSGLNYHVRAGFPDIDRIASVPEIVRNPARKTTSEEGLPVILPFINCRYKAHVRVVDFWPPTLANFSQCKGDPVFNPKATPEERAIAKLKYEWNFALLVEDAKVPAKTADDRIMLVFANPQAQNLLKIDACNLKQYPETLKQLEEKLFILWGNLWERKIALWEQDRVKLPLLSDDPRLQLQNKPFECCIEEHGEPIGRHAEATDWIQRFSTFNTTIMG